MPANPEPVPRVTAAGFGLAGVGFAWYVAGVVIAPGAPVDPPSDYQWFPPWYTVAAIVLSALLLGFAAFSAPRRRRLALFAAVPAALVGVFTGIDAVRNTEAGVVSTALPARTFGCLLLVIGALLVAARPAAADRWWRSARAARTCLLAAALSALLVAGALPVWTQLPGDGTTTASASQPAVPQQVTAATWRWHTPRGVSIRKVVSAGTGVVMTAGGEVIALDGTSGAERWRYRRGEAVPGTVVASVDGATVVVRFSHRDVVAPDSDVLVAFNTLTGEVRWERMDGNPDVVTAAFSTAIGKGADDELVGINLSDGAELWRHRMPEGYRQSSRVQGASGTVLVPLFAREGLPPEVLGLDERTGDEKWRLPVPPKTPAREPLLHSQPLLVVADGGLSARALHLHDLSELALADALAFDPGSGTPRTEPAGTLARIGNFPNDRVLLGDGSSLRIPTPADTVDGLERTTPDGGKSVIRLPDGMTTAGHLSELIVARGAIVLWDSRGTVVGFR